MALFRPTPEEVHQITGKTLENIQKNLPVIYAACDEFKFTETNPTTAVLATVACENDFAPANELGGADYYRRMYWDNVAARQSLGNSSAEAAIKYHGRGFVQLTGEANYRKMQEQTDLPLLANPGILVTDASASARVLLQFLKNCGADIHALWGDWWHIRRAVNGPGLNGWDYFAGKNGIVWKFLRLAHKKR